MKVTLFGSPTLNRFTEEILRGGLEACRCHVVPSGNDSDFGIIQIHGAPAAHEADLEIIQALPKIVSQVSACIILLHRPDEIKESIPQFRSILAALPATTTCSYIILVGEFVWVKVPVLSTPAQVFR